MVWAKLDDEILDNEKIGNAGVLGFAMHVAAITWCCRKTTDGFVPYPRVRLLLDLTDLGAELIEATGSPEGWKDKAMGTLADLGDVQADRIAEKLCSVGLWREDKERGGYWVHDFLDYNPSKAEADAAREARSSGGKKGAATRWGSKGPKSAESKAKVMGEPMASPMGQVMAPPMTERWLGDAPIPIPIPIPNPEDPRQGDRAGAGADRPVAEGTAAAEVVVSDYELAVATVTGAPFALDYRSGDRGRLVRLLATYCPGKPVDEVRAWVRESVTEWVTPRVGEPDFASGFAPRGFESWLRGGRKAPRKPVSFIGQRGAGNRQPHDDGWLKRMQEKSGTDGGDW